MESETECPEYLYTVRNYDNPEIVRVPVLRQTKHFFVLPDTRIKKRLVPANTYYSRSPFLSWAASPEEVASYWEKYWEREVSRLSGKLVYATAYRDTKLEVNNGNKES